MEVEVEVVQMLEVRVDQFQVLEEFLLLVVVEVLLLVDQPQIKQEFQEDQVELTLMMAHHNQHHQVMYHQLAHHKEMMAVELKFQEVLMVQVVVADQVLSV